jgi:hypothetical protein
MKFFQGNKHPKSQSGSPSDSENGTQEIKARKQKKLGKKQFVSPVVEFLF